MKVDGISLDLSEDLLRPSVALLLLVFYPYGLVVWSYSFPFFYLLEVVWTEFGPKLTLNQFSLR